LPANLAAGATVYSFLASCSADNDLDICFLNKTGANPELSRGSLDPIAHKLKFFNSSPYVLGGGNPDTFGAFARPATGTFGNSGRDWLSGPGLFNADISVAKSFNFTERLLFQLRQRLSTSSTTSTSTNPIRASIARMAMLDTSAAR
jgi:hypothetical protein